MPNRVFISKFGEIFEAAPLFINANENPDKYPLVGYALYDNKKLVHILSFHQLIALDFVDMGEL